MIYTLIMIILFLSKKKVYFLNFYILYLVANSYSQNIFERFFFREEKKQLVKQHLTASQLAIGKCLRFFFSKNAATLIIYVGFGRMSYCKALCKKNYIFFCVYITLFRLEFSLSIWRLCIKKNRTKIYTNLKYIKTLLSLDWFYMDL